MGGRRSRSGGARCYNKERRRRRNGISGEGAVRGITTNTGRKVSSSPGPGNAKSRDGEEEKHSAKWRERWKEPVHAVRPCARACPRVCARALVRARVCARVSAGRGRNGDGSPGGGALAGSGPPRPRRAGKAPSVRRGSASGRCCDAEPGLFFQIQQNVP